MALPGEQASAFSGILFRYGTVFLQNPGIPAFFGTALALYFHPGIFWKLFGIFRDFFFGAISDPSHPDFVWALVYSIY